MRRRNRRGLRLHPQGSPHPNRPGRGRALLDADGVTVLLLRRYIKWQPQVQLEIRRILGMVDVVTKGFYI